MNRLAARLEPLLIPGLLVLAAAFGVRRVYDWDIWWHLRSGQWIVEHRTIPRADPFSASAEGTEWIDLQWLFQLGAHALHQGTGWWGPTLAQAASATVTIGVLVIACGGTPIARRRVMVLLAAVLLLQKRLQLRPELLSFLFLTITILAIDRLSATNPRRYSLWRWLLLIGATQILWVNCHSLFVLGLIAGSSVALGDTTDLALRRGSVEHRSSPQKLVQVVLIPITQAIASLINPYGWTAFKLPVQVLSRISGERPEFTEQISEFHPTLTLLPFSPAAWLFLALLVGGVASMIRSRLIMPAWRFFLFFAFAYLAFKAQRNLPLFGLTAAAIICQNDRDRLRARAGLAQERQMRIGRWKLALDAAAIATVMTLLFSGWIYRWFRMETAFGVGLIPGRFPQGVAQRLVAEGDRVVVFPYHIGYGNYFLWRGFPAVRSFIDGRLEVHDAIYPTYLEMIGDLESAPARALTKLRMTGVTHLVIPYAPGSELEVMRRIREQPTVALRHVDGSGVLFALNGGQSIDTECIGFGNPAELDLVQSRRACPVSRIGAWLVAKPAGQEQFHLRAAAILLHVWDAPRAAVRELLKAATVDSSSPYLWSNLADAYRRLANASARDAWTSALRETQASHAEATYRSLAQFDSPTPPPLHDLSDARTNSGRLQSAVRLLEAGRYASSRGELRRLIASETLAPSDRLRAHWLLALIAMDLGDRDELVRHLHDVLDDEILAEFTSLRELAEHERGRCGFD